MRQRLTIILGGVVMLGLFGMASRLPLVGGPAPEIALKDLQGQEVRLSDLRGKVVLLNFWATWCKPCKEEMPAMQAAYDKLRDEGLVVLAVNELEDVQRVAEHVRSHGHTFPVVMDHDNRIANRYGVVGLPASFLIDRQGIVRERVSGSLLTEQRIADMVARYGAIGASAPRSAEVMK